MNKMRRQQLRKLICELEGLKSKLEDIQWDEQDYFDNMPENLQGSVNGMNSEEAIDKMDDALSIFDEVIEAIEDII